MVTAIKKGDSREKINLAIGTALKTKGVDAHKYCGVIKLREYPLVVQKKMRNEWE